MSHPSDKLAKLLEKALSKHKAKHYGEAEDLYRKILRDDASHLDATYLLGTLYAERGDVKRALQYMLSAQQLAPGSQYVQNNLGNIFRMQGDLQRASDCYRRALEIQPDMSQARNNLANILKRTGHTEQAIAQYEETIRHDPLCADAYYNLGKTYQDQGDWDKAAERYETVLNINPQHARALDGLGTCHMKRGRREDAIRRFEQYLNVAPQDECGARLKMAYLQAGEMPQHWSDQLLVETYQNKAATWDEDARQPDRLFLGPQLIRDAVTRHFPGTPSAIVLDLGCGTGACGEFLRPLADRLEGVDLSPHMLQQAGKKGLYDHLECADIVTYLARHQRSYDLLTASGVLIFFSDLQPVFAAAAAALKPGGTWIFTLYRSGDDAISVRENIHFAHSADYIRECAKNQGFEVAELLEAAHELDRGQPQPGWLGVLRKPDGGGGS